MSDSELQVDHQINFVTSCRRSSVLSTRLTMNLHGAALLRRPVHQFPSDGRGAGEQEQAAPPPGLGHRRPGLGHLQAGPVHAAADAAPGSPDPAAVPHPPRQVGRPRHERVTVTNGNLPTARCFEWM